MVNDEFTTAPGAERALALSYAPAGARAGVAALLALDDTLAGIVRAARDPLVGQMRLTWWHGALSGLDDGAAPPAQPVLEVLARHVLLAGVSGAAIAGMIDGWELLLDREPLTAERLAGYAAGRGGGLFGAAGPVLGAAAPADPLAAAGEGWALADLAAHVSDPGERAAAQAMARERLAAADARWSRAGRMLGALALCARMDLAERHAPAGAPSRVLRLMRFRLTGR